MTYEWTITTWTIKNKKIEKINTIMFSINVKIVMLLVAILSSLILFYDITMDNVSLLLIL